MVMDPYRRPADELNAVWNEKGWPAPTGSFEVFRISGEWHPFEEVKLGSIDWQINFSSKEWQMPIIDASGVIRDSKVEPPYVIIHARGEGGPPADRLQTGIDRVEALAGLVNLVLGAGYPVLTSVQRGAFRKTKKDRITYYMGRAGVQFKGLTKERMVTAFRPLGVSDPVQLPDHIKRALRWYGKGMLNENPVDRFISLWESCLAIVAPWHHDEHPEAYVDECDPSKRKDPAVKRMFGDWVRGVLAPGDPQEEKQSSRGFEKMVDTRNKVLKGWRLSVDEQDVQGAARCSVLLLQWACRDLIDWGAVSKCHPGSEERS